MPPRVTVLMTVYNGLPFLREAIESVLNQTWTDFEFLIINDASTDGSVGCIQSYRDSRIRLVCNEHNLGQARSLNKGLGLARGAYIARLDQDDVCLPNRLEEQVVFLEQRPGVAVVCSWEYSIDSQGRRIRSWRRELDDYGAFLGYLLVGKCPIWHPSVMFRREVVVDLGGYDESCAPAEDFDLWVRLAMRRCKAAVVPKPLVLQRIHDGRQSVKRVIVQWENTRRSHDRMIKAFCDGQGIELVTLLLRMEEGFWRECTSRRQLGAVLETLNELITNIQVMYQLSSAELASLQRVIYRRLGPGVRVGRKIVWLPSVLFYPIFFSLSPLLLPRVRRASSYLYGTLQALRYPGRLIQFGLERLRSVASK